MPTTNPVSQRFVKQRWDLIHWSMNCAPFVYTWHPPQQLCCNLSNMVYEGIVQAKKQHKRQLTSESLKKLKMDQRKSFPLSAVTGISLGLRFGNLSSSYKHIQSVSLLSSPKASLIVFITICNFYKWTWYVFSTWEGSFSLSLIKFLEFSFRKTAFLGVPIAFELL